MEPNFQRHPYGNIRFQFLSSPYLRQHFFPPLYHHFNISRSGGALPPTSPLHQHHHRIPLLAIHTLAFFSRHLTPIFTHHEALEPNLQTSPLHHTIPPCPPYAKMLFYGWPHTTITPHVLTEVLMSRITVVLAAGGHVGPGYACFIECMACELLWDAALFI